ncbi:unnamed protein product [Orchesella dallaii]|uniref:Uncharacterized protein n=1 Tax=Orchesella dallaii TaxID=48710 RepID=A0ABP1R9L7_9HEXA
MTLIYKLIMEKGSQKGDPILLRSSILTKHELNLALDQVNRVSVSESDVNIDISGINYCNSQSSAEWTHNARNIGAKGEFAVSVQDLCKSYEEGHPVLSNLSMSVRKGTM